MKRLKSIRLECRNCAAAIAQLIMILIKKKLFIYYIINWVGTQFSWVFQVHRVLNSAHLYELRVFCARARAQVSEPWGLEELGACKSYIL
jgi:hypothetical protein